MALDFGGCNSSPNWFAPPGGTELVARSLEAFPFQNNTFLTATPVLDSYEFGSLNFILPSPCFAGRSATRAPST